MGEIDVVRSQLISVYPSSSKWKARIMRMSNAQLYAIQLKFKREGKLK